MKVTVIGAGAMGGIWSAHLANAGHDVSVVDTSKGIVDAIQSSGIVVEEGDRRLKVPVKATTQVADLGPQDVVFFFVKAHHTAAAALAARALLGRNTLAVSLQNGWGNADIIAEHFDGLRLVVGVTYHSGTVLAPGTVAHTARGQTFVGPYVDGGDPQLAAEIGELLRAAGFEVIVTDQVKTEIWKKLVLNAATLPVAALTQLRAGELVQTPKVLELVDGLATEVVKVANALGYSIEVDERIGRIHSVLAGGGTGKPSMLQDVDARRKTEIEVINGAVVRMAAAKDVEVPLNRAMVALVGGLEKSWAR